jgi:hypothetical protein
MSQRLSDAMGKMNVSGTRNSIAGSSIKRNSVLAPETIKAMFPDAVKAIESNKADFTQATGIAPSNRNSTVGERASMIAPSINAPEDTQKEGSNPQPPLSPWGPRSGNTAQQGDRPKSSSSHQPMGQFTQPPPSAGLRSPRPLALSGDTNLNTTTLNAPDMNQAGGAPMLSPYAGSGNWASMVNTPMNPAFPQQSANQADMVANATAMKLAALSTVNNRIQLDDVRKYRRARSSEGKGGNHGNNGMAGNGNVNGNYLVTGINPETMTQQQLIALQNQQAQQAAALGRRSRPNSPGLAMHGAPPGVLNFASPQQNGFLAAGYDGTTPLVNSLAGLSLNQFGLTVPSTHEGYISDHSEINRGRSPRGRRASSKAPEDPTNPDLLQDIPSWLRSLRLHKYTDNLKDLKWTELIELDEKGLEDRGVNALGARRKMLKVSDTVKAGTLHN